ncbi:MAG TPA: signal recognition particle-docking protein FtsY [Kiritimatiellia bacterium]|nr:signal recognition particle-docking protein FtsY [Kiritimatiellia bacterium]
MVTWIDALARTRSRITGVLSRVLRGRDKPDDVSLEELEAILLSADVPARLVAHLIGELDKGYAGLRVSRRDMLKRMLSDALKSSNSFSWQRDASPLVVLVVGVNGSGKTTTCAKLAALARREGLRPLLGATDTFRAAGSDQLRLWADRIGCESVTGAAGADAAAVAYDAVAAALARDCNAVIIDTAGRMHTKKPLMQELQKVRNALDKKLPGAPHETWIVLDATLGQNAITQAMVFHEAVPLTGAIIAKLDGSSKAGFAFAVTKELGIPIRFAGLGEAAGDLVPFDPDAFAQALVGGDGSSESSGE